jgi:hypothetical protein
MLYRVNLAINGLRTRSFQNWNKLFVQHILTNWGLLEPKSTANLMISLFPIVNIPFIIIRNYVFQQQRLMGLTSTLIKGPGLNSFYGSKPPQWCNHVSLCDINPSKTIKWQHFKQSKPYSKLKYCRFIYFILYFVFDFQWR